MRYTKSQVESIIRKQQVQGIRMATLFGFLMGMFAGGGVIAVLVGTHAVNIDFSKLTPVQSVPQVVGPEMAVD